MGTSLMMDCCRLAFGDDRILGHKFPQEERIMAGLEKHEDETDDEFEAMLEQLSENEVELRISRQSEGSE